MPIVKASDGSELWAASYGRGTPLLLIPGLGGSARTWGPFPKALGTQFRTIVYDPRGLGRSGGDADSICMQAMVDDALAVLDGMAAEKAHVFGISLGGIVALGLADQAPERVRRLVLVSTSAGMTPFSRRVLADFDTLLDVLTPRAFTHILTTLSLSPPWLEAGPGKAADLERGLMPKPSEMPVLRAQVRSLIDLDGKPLPCPSHPALVIAGERDAIVPVEHARRLVDRMPDARLSLLPGGHACLIESAERGVLDILKFLREEDQPGPFTKPTAIDAST